MGDVVLGKFSYGSENVVGTAYTQGGIKRKVRYELGAYIFHTGASTEIRTTGNG